MAFDFKKEYKEFYMPKNKPSILTVPAMNYIAVRGHGDPNQEDGEYKQAIGLLYGIAFTIKMSKKGDHQIKGYFDYVVPPLEGFWWQDLVAGRHFGSRLCSQGRLQLDLCDPSAGFCDEGRFRLGCQRGGKEKETGFLES